MWLIMLHDGKDTNVRASKTTLEGLASKVHAQSMSRYQVGAVDCRVHGRACREAKSTSTADSISWDEFPVFVFVAKGECFYLQTKTPQLTAQTLDKFCRSHIPTKKLIQSLRAVGGHSNQSLHTFLAKAKKDGKLYAVIKMDPRNPGVDGSQPRSRSPLYTVLAHHYRTSVAFAEVRGDDGEINNTAQNIRTELISLSGKSADPSFKDEPILIAVALQETELRSIPYAGGLTGEAISQWIGTELLPEKPKKKEQVDQGRRERKQRRQEKLKQQYPERVDALPLSVQIENATVLDNLLDAGSNGCVIVSKRKRQQEPAFPFSNDLVRKYGQFFRFGEYDPFQYSDLGRKLVNNHMDSPEVAMTERRYNKTPQHVTTSTTWYHRSHTRDEVAVWLDSMLTEVHVISNSNDVESVLLPRMRSTGCGLLLIARTLSDEAKFETMAKQRLGHFSFAKVVNPDDRFLQSILPPDQGQQLSFSSGIVAFWCSDWKAEHIVIDRELYRGPIDGALEDRLDKLYRDTQRFAISVTTGETIPVQVPKPPQKATQDQNPPDQNPNKVDDCQMSKLQYREVNRKQILKIRTEKDFDLFLRDSPLRPGSVLVLHNDSDPVHDAFHALVEPFGQFFRFGEVNIQEDHAIASVFFKDGQPGDGLEYPTVFMSHPSPDRSGEVEVSWYYGPQTNVGLRH